MTPLEPSWERRRLRAPCEDGETLAIPPLADMPAVVAKNREQISTWDAELLGKPLAEIRRLAREEVLMAAERFTHQPDALARGCHDPSLARRAGADCPLIVSGHQPELFHPGVWAKNFVLDRLAKETGGIGLHLIVDNDAVSSTRIAVPVGSREAPRIESIPFDIDAGSIPWEEATLRDETLFRTFADRVSAKLACWPLEPMLAEIWPAAIERLPPMEHAAQVPPPRLSDLLTIVRRAAERRLGLNNLELSISQLCETESFAWFVCSLLSDPQRTHAVYNEVVAEYRRVNRVRNRQHPVLDLGVRLAANPITCSPGPCGLVDSAPFGNQPTHKGSGYSGDWLESPFWIWRAGDSRRGRLFVRAISSELQLANGETVIGSLPRPVAGSAKSTVAQLRALSSRGWKLRPRALTNTLFARVFLADAFLHGIGGAKYDEMTDRLIVRLFGLTPPSFLTVTATHRLPLGGWEVAPSDVAALKHRLWDFDHTPERHLSVDVSPSLLPPGEGGQRPDEGRATSDIQSRNPLNADSSSAGSTPISELLAEKQRLIAEQLAQDSMDWHDPRRASRGENNQRRQRLRAISQQLAQLDRATRAKLTAQRQAAETQLAANSVLLSREFSFCLFSFECAKTLAKALIGQA